MILSVPIKDLLASGKLADGLKALDQKIEANYAANRLHKDNHRYKPVAIITDDLKAGVNGLVNHADGKRYDSKSEFRRATRRAGCYEVGNSIDPRDIKVKTPLERGIRGDYNVRPQLKEALERVIGS